MTQPAEHSKYPDRLPLVAQYDNMLSCIRCGLCSSVCPTYQETFKEEESPRGRIAMARAFTEGHLDLTPDFIAHSDSCLLCDACTAICPAGVQMEPIGVAVRQALEAEAQGRGSRAQKRALRLLFSNMPRLRAAIRGLALYQRTGAQAIARKSGLLRLFGLSRSERLIPAIRGGFISANGQRWRPQGGEPAQRVALFTGCVMSTLFADTNRATASVLARNGCEVVATAGQGCCGALHTHTGDPEGARALARSNIDAFERDGSDLIIVNAAGCGSALKGYGELLHDDPKYAQRARAFSARVRDVTELLATLAIDTPSVPTHLTVTYQEPCHLAHAQRIRQQPRRVLAAIPGVRLVEMAESSLCCGSAGVYNVTQPEMAESLLRRKVNNIMATGADVVVTANPGCFMQVAAGLRDAGSPIRVMHIVDLLQQAYDAAAPKAVVGETPQEASSTKV